MLSFCIILLLSTTYYSTTNLYSYVEKNYWMLFYETVFISPCLYCCDNWLNRKKEDKTCLCCWPCLVYFHDINRMVWMDPIQIILFIKVKRMKKQAVRSVKTGVVTLVSYFYWYLLAWLLWSVIFFLFLKSSIATFSLT